MKKQTSTLLLLPLLIATMLQVHTLKSAQICLPILAPSANPAAHNNMTACPNQNCTYATDNSAHLKTHMPLCQVKTPEHRLAMNIKREKIRVSTQLNMPTQHKTDVQLTVVERQPKRKKVGLTPLINQEVCTYIGCTYFSPEDKYLKSHQIFCAKKTVFERQALNKSPKRKAQGFMINKPLNTAKEQAAAQALCELYRAK